MILLKCRHFHVLKLDQFLIFRVCDGREHREKHCHGQEHRDQPFAVMRSHFHFFLLQSFLSKGKSSGAQNYI